MLAAACCCAATAPPPFPSTPPPPCPAGGAGLLLPPLLPAGAPPHPAALRDAGEGQGGAASSCAERLGQGAWTRPRPAWFDCGCAWRCSARGPAAGVCSGQAPPAERWCHEWEGGNPSQRCPRPAPPLQLAERAAELQNSKLGGLQWDAAVLDFLTDKARLVGGGSMRFPVLRLLPAVPSALLRSTCGSCSRLGCLRLPPRCRPCSLLPCAQPLSGTGLAAWRRGGCRPPADASPAVACPASG